MATWTRRVPDMDDRFDGAMASGLLAAAYVYYNELKRRLAGGYTSGAFVTGHLLNSITIAPPVYEGRNLVVRVGTMLLYALAWEVGHNNLFTRRFERQERWFPTAIDTATDQRRAFAAAFGAGLANGATLGTDLELNLPAEPRQGPNLPPSPYPSNPLGRTRTRRRA